MTLNEINLIKEIYNFLSETNFNLLKKVVTEIENNHLKLPFKVSLKKESFFKFLSSIFVGVYGYPFGLLYYKAEKDEKKRQLLAQKNKLKNQIYQTLKKTSNEDVKKILTIFLTSL